MGFFEELFNLDGPDNNAGQSTEFGQYVQSMNWENNSDLLSAGLNPDDLDGMGYFERTEALENAGLDPNDFGL